MKRKTPLVIFAAAILLLGGQLSSPIQRSSLQSELAQLVQRGLTYRFLDNTLVEITNPLSGGKKLKSLQEPSEADIRSWATVRGVPILEINPSQIDTNQYAGWYDYWTEVPLSNLFGNPLVVGDLDQNGKPEVYGVYLDPSTNYETRVYQVDDTGSVLRLYTYPSLYGISRYQTNTDRDSLKEIAFTLIGVLYDLEQSSPFSLPVILNFQHNRYQGGIDPGHTGIFIGNLDGDTLTDFLYKGSERDSSDSTMRSGKIYVSEFNPDSNNFVRVWATQFVQGQQSTTAGFAVEDFDRDGKMEFAVSEGLRGRVFFAENVVDNNYAQVWQDSTPYVNLYYQTSGDIDNDSRPEFFVAATMANGTWVLVYEADDNKSYSLRFIFHLLAGGTFDDPTLLTSDIDGDGKKELVILSGVYLLVFKSNANDEYHLWYMKREDTKDAVQVYDFDHNGKQDFIISKLLLDSLNRGRFKADVYLASGLVSVPNSPSLPRTIVLQPNYPNPFNGNTRISYSVSNTQWVSIRVYDILGREVSVLVNEMLAAGDHQTIWDASNMASGIYFYRLTTDNFSSSKKLLLLR